MVDGTGRVDAPDGGAVLPARLERWIDVLVSVKSTLAETTVLADSEESAAFLGRLLGSVALWASWELWMALQPGLRSPDDLLWLLAARERAERVRSAGWEYFNAEWSRLAGEDGIGG